MKWTYVSKGHYSTPDTGGWTIHALASGIVYKTHPSRRTVDVTGAKADRYIESAGAKLRAKQKSITKPKPKKTSKQQVKKVAKKVATRAGKVIGTACAFAEMIGEAEEAAYTRRAAPRPKKHAKPKRRREQTLEEYMGF